MTVPIPAGYFLATWEYQVIGNSRAQTTALAFESAAVNTVVGSTIFDAWQAHMGGGALSDQYTWSLFKLEDAATVFTNSPALAGTATDAVIPPNCCANATKVTELRGHANHGMMKIPAGFVPESAVSDGGVMTTALASSIDSNLQAFLEAVNASESAGVPVILHKDALVLPTPVQGLQTELMIGKIGRRLRGR